MTHFLESKRIKAALIILGGIAVLFVVFGLGVVVGYHKAIFASRWGENYSSNFYFEQGPMDMMGESGPWNAHGVAGVIIDIASGTLSVKDIQNNERSVVIIPETVIRSVSGTITADGLKIGQNITAIGEPNEQGQLIARFIRIVPASSSLPLPPGAGPY
jgi:hypothetical protein